MDLSTSANTIAYVAFNLLGTYCAYQVARHQKDIDTRASMYLCSIMGWIMPPIQLIPIVYAMALV